MRLRNSYRLETLAGIPILGDFNARRLREFIPREGTQLHQDQQAHLRQLGEQGIVDTGVEQDDMSIADSGRDGDAEETKDASLMPVKEDEPREIMVEGTGAHHRPSSFETTPAYGIVIEGSRGSQMGHRGSADDEDVVIFKGGTCSRGVRDRSEVT